MNDYGDLIAFLRARLDEREAKAREAGIKVLDDDGERLVTTPESLSWAVEREGDYTYVQDADGTNVALAADVSMRDEDWEPITVGRAEHIADSDPAWVLADVESKRKIVDLCVYMLWEYEGRGPDPVAAGTLRLLTLPYAARTDYREEWKP